ncbi:Lactobacillus shifted protein [Spathaspora sp. JA1]|nr:Lactobacillus shifted protein [Spathaspora sp. JA1]
MLRITSRSRPTVASLLRFNSNLARPEASNLTKEQLTSNEFAKQAPNKDSTWSQTQESRSEIISKYPYRFVQKDLQQQPRPYAAIDLIAKEPVRYLGHGENIAVCDGNKGSTLQGHPKVFINLDQPKPATCGYCGLRYAKEEFKDLIEAQEKA